MCPKLPLRNRGTVIIMADSGEWWLGHIADFSWVIRLWSACVCMADSHLCSMAHFWKLSEAHPHFYLCRSMMSQAAQPQDEQQQVSTPHLTAAVVLDLPTFNPPGFQSAASLPCSAHSAAVKCTRQQARSVARAAATQTYPVLWGLQLATVSTYCPCSPTQLARANTLHVGRASTAKMGPCRSPRLGRSESDKRQPE
jgi:hypothetical protein